MNNGDGMGNNAPPRTPRTPGTPLARIVGRFGPACGGGDPLGALRAAIRAAEVRHYAGRFPADAAAVLAEWVDAADGYVRDRERLRAEGWDVAALLRRLPPLVEETVALWAGDRQARGSGGEISR